jgi:hypothetical protein
VGRLRVDTKLSKLVRRALRDQTGFPGEIGTRRIEVAFVAVMHEEQVIDALAIGRR